MTSATICILIAIVVYLVLMLYIGVRFAKKNNNADDFYLGGRKLGPLVTAMSAEASDGNRPGRGYIPQLAYRGQAHPALQRADGLHYRAGVFLQALW